MFTVHWAGGSWQVSHLTANSEKQSDRDKEAGDIEKTTHDPRRQPQEQG